MAINLKAMIAKLDDNTRGALEAAAGLCLARTHYDIEIEHYLLKLLDANDSDLSGILREFGVDRTRFARELSGSLDKLKSGNARTPSFSPSLVKMLSAAWTVGSMEYDAARVRPGFTILALVGDEELSRLIAASSREFSKVQPDALRKQFGALVSSGGEEVAPASVDGPLPTTSSKTPHLDQYTANLTENARRGKIDPVLSRDAEIRQIIDILCRRRQNNPILTGEAGVGKTAVVEGFAIRVANAEVPPSLQGVSVRMLDLALLQAGAGIKGEFENRLKGLIQEVKSSPAPIILFIDEAHTMIGAGGQAGQGDAANLLKPALARGELRTIAATTWSEYKKYFEKDPALARRFQVVKVDEPSETQCEVMLRGVAETLERHHQVRVLDEGLRAAVRLSHRYLPERQLPDKAVSVLDTACARLSLGQNSKPAAIEDAIRRRDDLLVQQRILERESALGVDHAERLANVAAGLRQGEAELDHLQSRWQRESELVSRIREVRTALEENSVATVACRRTGGGGVAVEEGPNPVVLRTELADLNVELDAMQGETPLLRVCVDAQVVGDVVSAWTGIPIGKMLKDEMATVLSLEEHLGKRVIGQSHALTAISERIRTSKASLEDPVKPVGVFLLVGPSGVGKTETALALSDLLYGGERNLITINMSEFQEAHTVSTLKGSPPGYVGYGEGGVLTEAVRRHPYSVVLLDEVEKAHPDVLELFFQVFDKGRMEDGEGRQIDFRNTIIILTSNAGTDTLMNLTADPETAPGPDALVQALRPELNRLFKPAFLGRLVIVPYYPVRDENLRRIVLLKLGKIQRRIQENHRIAVTHDGPLVDEVVRRCTEAESGARNIDNILTNSLLPGVSRHILERLAHRQQLESIHVSLDASGDFRYE